MRYLTIPTILLVTGLVLAAPPKVIEEFTGKVIGVTDGDTIKVLVNKETITIRLEGIVRHNERCEHFKNTKKGRLCGPTDGKACGICGG